MTCHQYLTFPPSCHNLLYLRPSSSPHFSFVTDKDLRGRNVLHIDSIATCLLETDHLFTLHRSMSLYQINGLYMYHGNANERQGRELHMVKKEKGMEKQQLTGPEPATSRSIADPMAAEPRSPPASIDPFPH